MTTPVVRTLDCGMPLIVETIPGVRSVGVAWLLAAGTAREPDDRLGMSAMWADLTLRGAGELDSRAHADALDRLGVARGCSVETHSLRLSATLLGARLHDALPLMADMALRPRAAAEAIEPVRDLCMQAVEALQDDPQERVLTLARRLHNPAPLNRSPLGQLEGLKQITLDELLDWRREVVRPKGSAIGVAGDCDADRVQARLNELLAGWEGESPERTPRSAPERGQHHEVDDTNQVHIALCHDAPPEPDGRSMLERVIAAALSGGMSGRLFTEVREKRSLCYSVYATYRGDRDFGRVLAYAGTTPERAQETLDVLHGELQRICGPAAQGGGIDEGEFRRAVVGLKSRIVMAGESTSGRSAALVDDWRRLGRARSLEELSRQVDAVTLEAVNDYLSTRSLGPLTIATIGPEGLKPPA